MMLTLASTSARASWSETLLFCWSATMEQTRSTTKAIAAGKLAEEKTARLTRPRLYSVMANSTRIPFLNCSSIDRL